MNSYISQNSSFTVNGFLGTNSNTSDIPIILEFDTTDLFISSNSHKLRLQINKKQVLHGVGTLVGQDENNSQIVTKVYLTLDGFSQVISNKSFSTNGSVAYTKYKVLSAFIGDFFVTKETIFNNVSIYLTNFSSWLSSKCNNPDYFFPSPNKPQVTVKTPDVPDIIASSKLNQDLQIMRNYFVYNAQSSLTAVTTKVGVTNYIKLKNVNTSLSDFLLLGQQINSWYNLLTGTSETIYRISGTKKSSSRQLEVQLFNSNTSKANLNDFSFITTFSPRNQEWYQDCINSLYTWIHYYDDLISISNSVKPDQPGEIDQQLQNECVALQLIFDTFYKNEYLKKNPPENSDSKNARVAYVDAIEYILTNKISSDLVSEAVTKYDKKLNLRGFSEQIRNIRNTLSHSSPLKEHVSLEKRILLRAILKVLIRDWLLSFIGIDKKYRDTEYRVNKPYNFSIIQAW